METAKPLEFKGTAGGYFVFTLVSIVLMYLPILGWAWLLNYSAGWFADNTLVNGKKVYYRADYGETLKFMFINTLLLAVTAGIYLFWFVPKMYRYAVDHTHYFDEVTAAMQSSVIADPVATPVMPASVSPVNPVAPAAPVSPVDPTPPVTPSGTTPSVG